VIGNGCVGGGQELSELSLSHERALQLQHQPPEGATVCHSDSTLAATAFGTLFQIAHTYGRFVRGVERVLSDPPGAGCPQRYRRASGERLMMGRRGEITMLYTIAVILLIAWLLGVVGTYTIGAFVHVLLVVALVLFVVGLLSGRRSLA